MSTKFNGSVLKEARENAGLTLLELSMAIHKKYGTTIDISTISRWENCPTSRPRSGNLQRVADLLGINVSTLYCNDEKEADNLEDINIVEMMYKLLAIYKADQNDERLARVNLILR